MVTDVLKYRQWSKAEMRFAFFMLAVLVSELVVIFFINTEAGSILARILASLGTGAAGALFRLWKWTYQMVGPMVFPLFVLSIVELRSVYKLFICWRERIGYEFTENHYKTLRIVEGVAPGFGFLGTCISLIFTMHHMDPSLNQSAMLKALLDNSSSAFGSTVYGISLAITAFLAQEIFKGFLIQPKTDEEKGGGISREEEETASMDLIRREV